MKPALTALINYLNSTDATIVADLYTFQTVTGETYRFAEYNMALTIPSTNFPGSPLNYNAESTNISFLLGPRFSRSKTTQRIGVEPDSLTIEVYPNPASDFLGEFTWQSVAQSGGFDGATVELDRFYMPIGGDGFTGPLNVSLGTIVWFYGIVSEPLDISRSMIRFTVKDLRNLLAQQQMPRRLFQTGCTHIFGDAMCGYNRVSGENALGTATGYCQTLMTAASGSTQAVLIVGSLTPSVPNTTYYAQGTAIGVSGANAGVKLTISNITTGDSLGVYTQSEWPWPVNVGDEFYLQPGCDHSSGTCNGIFQNLLRYGGFDYIPPPEIAL